MENSELGTERSRQDSSAEEELLATFQLLREVQSYLSRLPAHPSTHEVIRRIGHHLESPAAIVQLQRGQWRAERIRWQLTGLTGGSSFLPVGVPVIQAELIGTTLKLQSPALAYAEDGKLDAAEAERAVLLQMKGVSIEMRPPVSRLVREAGRAGANTKWATGR